VGFAFRPDVIAAASGHFILPSYAKRHDGGNHIFSTTHGRRPVSGFSKPKKPSLLKKIATPIGSFSFVMVFGRHSEIGPGSMGRSLFWCAAVRSRLLLLVGGSVRHGSLRKLARG
jgi:hypothetical protein